MAGSFQVGSFETRNYVMRKFQDGGTILDVGAGSGKYAYMFNKHFTMDAVEVFEKNITDYNLDKLYRKVYNCDILDFDFEYYDIIIMGDVLEHIETEQAQALIEKLKGKCKELIVAVPYEYEQGELYNNKYEIHKQADLTPTIFNERYKGFKPVFMHELYGIYALDKNDKMLSIIIPQFNENEIMIKPLLDGITGQVGIDYFNIEVIIINGGGGHKLNEKFLSLYRQANLRYLTADKDLGPGYSRQYGLDNCNSDYVMFVDADDRLYSVFSLRTIINNIASGDYDYLHGQFLSEGKYANGLLAYENKKDTCTWIHSKIYRRLFLAENNIRFPKELKTNEDAYFNELVKCTVKPEREKHINEMLTVWKFNENSITRKDNYEFVKSKNMLSYIKSKIMLYGEMRKRKNAKIYENVNYTCCYLYFYMQQEFWFSVEAMMEKIETEKAIWKFREKFMEEYSRLEEKSFLRIYNQARKVMEGDATFHEFETYKQFWQRLGADFSKKN